MKLPAPLQQRWNTLLPREKTLVQTSIALIALALIWWLAVAPALQTLRNAEARHQTLDTQLQQMKRLQAQAVRLQTQPKIGFDEALRALETSVKQQLGGTGQLNIAGDRATVTLKATPAETLAPWLAQVRTNARALPVEARLVRTPGSTTARWDGTVVLTLPAR